jgi:hypothetical protein
MAMNFEDMNALAKSLVPDENVKEAMVAVQEFGKSGGKRLTKETSIANYQVRLYNVTSSVIRSVLKAAKFVELDEKVLYTDETKEAIDSVLRQGRRKAGVKVSEEQLEAENADIHGNVIRSILRQAMEHGAAPGGDLFVRTVTPAKRVVIGGEEVSTYETDSQQEVRLTARNEAKVSGAGAPKKKRGPPTPVQDEIQDDTEPVTVKSGRAKKIAKRKSVKPDSPPGSPEARPRPASPEAGPAPKPEAGPAPKPEAGPKPATPDTESEPESDDDVQFIKVTKSFDVDLSMEDD